MTTISLKNDLNINKTSIRKNVDQFVEDFGIENDRMTYVMDALTLLHNRGDVYTIKEAEELLGWYITSSDECIFDNEEDYNPLQVYNTKKKMDRFNAASEYLKIINK